ncbi:hypothetical protein [Nonomuraea salmonea]|uniref:hypothetical protein n=1 Tax=Nonomuraea salmonea TaxID=46181 RepID=UPI0031ED020A
MYASGGAGDGGGVVVGSRHAQHSTVPALTTTAAWPSSPGRAMDVTEESVAVARAS